jgi:hypothetical protein
MSMKRICLSLFLLIPLSANSESEIKNLPKHLDAKTVIFVNGILPLGLHCKIAIFLDSGARTAQLMDELKKLVGKNKVIAAVGDMKTAAPFGFHITDSRGTRIMAMVDENSQFSLKRDEIIENFSVISVTVNEFGLKNARKIVDEQLRDAEK